MLRIGNYNQLKVVKKTAMGAFLSSEMGDILLPGRLVPADAEVGAVLNVFVYVDSEERLTATTKRPRAEVGDFALLRVKDNVSVGTFLDWGVEKDLLLPFGEQIAPLRRGDQVLVRIYLHSSDRVAASARLDKFLQPADGSLVEGQQVELLVYAFSDLGAKVVVNNHYSGLLFKNELYIKPAIGERLPGYVKKIRPDGKIDVVLRMGAARDAASDREVVLEALKANQGTLPLNDKSTPEAISKLLRMSKKSFKKTVGGLYKEGVLEMTDDGIRLRSGR